MKLIAEALELIVAVLLGAFWLAGIAISKSWWAVIPFYAFYVVVEKVLILKGWI